MEVRTDHKKTWFKIIYFARPYIIKQKYRFTLTMIVLIAGSTVSSISPYIWGRIIDSIMIGHIMDLIKWLSLYLCVILLIMCLRFLEDHLRQKLCFITESEIRKALLNRILNMQCKDLDQFDIGFMVSSVISDAGRVSSFVFDVLTSIVTIGVNIVVALYFSISISFLLSATSFVFIPFSIVSNLALRKYFRQLSESQREYRDQSSSFYIGTLGHIVEIKAYCLENDSINKFNRLTRTGWGLQRKRFTLEMKTSLLSTFISSLSTATTLILSTYLIATGSFSLGGMVSFQKYVDRFTSSVSTLMQMNFSAQSTCVAVDRIISMLSHDDENLYASRISAPFSIAKLEFKGVCFRYLSNAEVLKSVEFCLDSPGIYAVVGENGCGKSTVLKLIMRFYRVQAGRILLNGISIDDISTEAIRKSVGYYSKDVYIQDGTLRENLLLGSTGNKSNIDTKILENICVQIGLQDFIAALPQGLETHVGENGKLLSSGQKQKIATVRAVLDEASVLLFDEITSDLDGESEKRIMSVIHSLAQSRIVLMVTHRIQSVLFATHVMLLEDGHLTDSGTHEDLMQSSSKYRSLFEKQNDLSNH